MKYSPIAPIVCIVIIIIFFRWKIVSVLRKVHILRDLNISKKQALEIGRLEYEKRGYTDWNPSISEEIKYWRIYTNNNVKGAPIIKIDKNSGYIYRFATLSR